MIRLKCIEDSFSVFLPTRKQTQIFKVEFHPVKKDDETNYHILIQAIEGWSEPGTVKHPACGIAHKELRKYLKEKKLL